MPEFVQGKVTIGNGEDPFDTSIVLTLDAPVVVGNLLAVWAFWGTVDPHSSIVDNLGNVYTLVEENAPAGGGADTHALWVAPVTVGGACTITITLAVNAGYRSMLAHEVSGVDLDAPANVSSFNMQEAPTADVVDGLTSGAAVTTVDGCYIFGVTAAEQTGAVGIDAGTGFTERVGAPGSGTPPGSGEGAFASEERIQPVAGSVAATFTLVATAKPMGTSMMALAPAAAAAALLGPAQQRRRRRG